MRILIAEDDTVARLLLKNTLVSFGHDVIETDNGATAWARYSEDPVRLLILDWMMPNLDDLDLCQAVRAEKRPVYTYIIICPSWERTCSHEVLRLDSGPVINVRS